MIVQNMMRDPFRQVLKYIHYADYTKLVGNDKIWKLSPLINKLKKHF